MIQRMGVKLGMPPLQKDIPLAPYTTLQVGGAAAYYVEVDTEADVAAISEYTKAEGVPLTILGGGSNVLVSDSGVSGVVMRMKLRGREYVPADDVVYATLAAGEEFDAVVAETVANGYWGLENLSHIPGLVGATPIQNVGAYGVEICDVVETVRVYDQEAGGFCSLTADECQFGYRDSLFKRQPGRYIVTAVTFRLRMISQPQLTYQGLQAAGLTDQSTLVDIREAIISIRAAKFPNWHAVGTAGSFFKNPIIPDAEAARLQSSYPDVPTYPAQAGYTKVSLGYVLDKVCGLCGYQVGPVGLFHKQALVLVVHEGATATMVDAFAKEVADRVREATGIVVEREVTGLGFV